MKEFTRGPDICIEGAQACHLEGTEWRAGWNCHVGRLRQQVSSWSETDTVGRTRIFFFSYGPVDTLHGSQMWFILEVSLQRDLPFKTKATQETMTGDVWKSWWGLIKSASECIAHNSDTFANWRSLTVSLKNLYVFPLEEGQCLDPPSRRAFE